MAAFVADSQGVEYPVVLLSLLETFSWLAVNQKHSGLFVQVAFIILPFPDALADDEFVVTGEVAGDA